MKSRSGLCRRAAGATMAANKKGNQRQSNRREDSYEPDLNEAHAESTKYQPLDRCKNWTDNARVPFVRNWRAEQHFVARIVAPIAFIREVSSAPTEVRGRIG